MDETTDIHAIDMVRRIRDQQADELRGKSDEEVIAYFRRASEEARADAERRLGPPESRRKSA